ncbi:hypothetical protein HOF92_12085 [bacterium]|jgi:hypothetical protein|nr:hypothetical protein [bacterium]
MSRKKINYAIGDCFLIPLREGGFARGIIARMNNKGSVFGYFFGPQLSQEKEFCLDGIEPSKAILIGKFGDLGLLKKEWKIKLNLAGFDLSQWPMPQFFRKDLVSEKAWLSKYDEESFKFLSETPTTKENEHYFPYDRDMGYGAVEIRLTHQLKQSE